MGVWIKRAAAVLGADLKVGAPSAAALLAATRPTAAFSYGAAHGTYVALSCLDGVLGAVEGLSSCVSEPSLLSMVRGGIVPNQSIPAPVGPIGRLNKAYMVVGNMSSIVEVSCGLSNRADAILFMRDLLQQVLVDKPSATSLVQAATMKLSSSLSSTGVSAEDIKKMEEKVRALMANCPEEYVGEDPLTAVDSAGGGAYTANDFSERSSTGSDSLPPQLFNWMSFKSARAVGHRVLVELVDKDMNLRSITRSGGFVVRALQLQMAPSSLTINSVKLSNREQTLGGWVEEHWGDDLDQVTFSGRSLSFIADVEGVRTLVVDSRADSAAYLEMQALVDIYKTNGLVIQDNSPPKGQERKFYGYASSTAPLRVITSHPRRGMVKERFYVRITFDFVTVIGYFESFELIDRADSPFAVDYSLSFKAEQTLYH